ncbi:MAG TPA: T9SS type A sorting domain-containing protein [Bacteroidia bacterium]|jgi:hypothetical protein|nr:T9SS type A sorting domain-containing protein [Bacteroidia bacterium]
MNKLLLTIFIALLGSAIAHAQSNSFVGKFPNVTVKDVEPVTGGYMLLGQSSGQGQWARTDTAGVVLSSKSYPISFSDVRFLPDKGFITIFQNTDSTFSVMKIDSSGKEVWINLYKLPTGEVIAMNNLSISIDKYPAGYWITGGMYKSTYHGFMIQADSLGNIMQSRMVSGDTNISGEFYGGIGNVLQGGDRSYYFSINANFFEEGTNMAMVKTDSALHIKWCKDLAVDLPGSNGIVMDGNKIIVASAAYDNTYHLTYAAVIEIDTSGNQINSVGLNAEVDPFNALCITRDSGIIIASNTRVPGRVGPVSFALKLNSLWQEDWEMVYPKNESEFGDNICCVRQANPGYIMGGNWLIKTDNSGSTTCDDSALSITIAHTSGINNRGVYFYPLTIAKSVGSITVTNISDTINYVCGPLGINEPTQTKEIIKLFPNPNNGVFQLGISNYELGKNTVVEIYNMLGEKVYSKQGTINNEKLTIQMQENPAGIYLYRVLSENGNLVGEGKFIKE